MSVFRKLQDAYNICTSTYFRYNKASSFVISNAKKAKSAYNYYDQLPPIKKNAMRVGALCLVMGAGVGGIKASRHMATIVMPACALISTTIAVSKFARSYLPNFNWKQTIAQCARMKNFGPASLLNSQIMHDAVALPPAVADLLQAAPPPVAKASLTSPRLNEWNEEYMLFESSLPDDTTASTSERKAIEPKSTQVKTTASVAEAPPSTNTTEFNTPEDAEELEEKLAPSESDKWEAQFQEFGRLPVETPPTLPLKKQQPVSENPKNFLSFEKPILKIQPSTPSLQRPPLISKKVAPSNLILTAAEKKAPYGPLTFNDVRSLRPLWKNAKLAASIEEARRAADVRLQDRGAKF